MFKGFCLGRAGNTARRAGPHRHRGPRRKVKARHPPQDLGRIPFAGAVCDKAVRGACGYNYAKPRSREAAKPRSREAAKPRSREAAKAQPAPKRQTPDRGMPHGPNMSAQNAIIDSLHHHPARMQGFFSCFFAAGAFWFESRPELHAICRGAARLRTHGAVACPPAIRPPRPRQRGRWPG